MSRCRVTRPRHRAQYSCPLPGFELRDRDAHAGAFGQPIAFRRHTRTDAAAVRGPPASGEWDRVPRSLPGREAPRLGGAYATRRGEAQAHVPQAVPDGSCDPGLCGRRKAGCGGVSRPVGRALAGADGAMLGVAAHRDRAGGAPGAAGGERAGRGEDRQPVRAAHRHRPQGRPGDRVRTQDQSRHGPQRPGARRGGGARQSRGQRTLSADAGTPLRALRQGAEPCCLRRRLRREGEPETGPGAGGGARGLQQKARTEGG